MKKSILLLFLLLLHHLSTIAQNTSIEWAKNIGGSEWDYALGMTIDNEGNVYTIGLFHISADLDPGPGVYEVVSNDDYGVHPDIYIQKLNKDGEFVWGRAYGGSTTEYSRQIAVDTNGNLYIAGYFSSTVDFDPGPGETFLTSSTSGNDVFIQKLDTAGNFLWAKKIGGSGHESTPAMKTDQEGNIYMAGSFEGAMDLNPNWGGTDFKTATFRDSYLIKLDTDGGYIWGHAFSSTSSSYISSLTLDDFGHIVMGGTYSGTIDFDPSSSNYNATSLGSDDIFVHKMDTAGNHIWAKTMGGFNLQYGGEVSTDAFGNIYHIGNFHDTVDFDPGPGVYELGSDNGYNVYIMKMDSNGSFNWAKSFGGSYQDFATNIVSDDLGFTYITGGFGDTVDFDLNLADTLMVVSAGSYDYFLMKLDPEGNMKWNQIIGTINSELGYDVALDDSNNIYVNGVFGLTVDFDPTSGVHNLTSNGLIDGFVQKINQCITESVDSVTACNSFNWVDNQTYTSSNHSAYHVFSNANGCDSIVYLNLTLNQLSSEITLNNTTIEAEEDGALYQWLNCNANYSPVVGATDQNFEPTQDGQYALEVTKYGCVDTSSCLTITHFTIEDIQQDHRIRLYPNPTNGDITINTEEEMSKTIQVYNMLGKLMLNYTNIQDNDFKMTLPQSSGMYIIEVGTAYYKKQFRIIKE